MAAPGVIWCWNHSNDIHFHWFTYQALADPYFKGLAKAEREPSCQPITKMEFEFERRKVTKEDVKELIFREILEYHPQLLKDYMNGTEKTNFLYPRFVPWILFHQSCSPPPFFLFIPIFCTPLVITNTFSVAPNCYYTVPLTTFGDNLLTWKKMEGRMEMLFHQTGNMFRSQGG